MESKELTVEEIIKNRKSRVKLVNIVINDENYQIPVWYASSVHKNYLNKYETINNYRKAFCYLVYKMYMDNKKICELKDIDEKTIEKIADEDLEKIGHMIIEEHDYLKKHYICSDDNIFFEDFYNAVKKANDELIANTKGIVEKFTRPSKIIDKAIRATKALDKIVYPYSSSNIGSMVGKLTEMEKFIEKQNNKEELLPPPEDMLINPTLEILIESKEEQREYFKKSYELDKEMVKHLSNQKIAKWTLVIAVLSFIISLIGRDNVIFLFKNWLFLIN